MRRAILLFPVILVACNMFSTTPITRDIALGDLDGDGDLDAYFANGESENVQPNSVWINQGGGEFQDSGQSLGPGDTQSIALGDLDGDGDLDAIEGGWGLIYINNGYGRFTGVDRSISPVDGNYTRYPTLGDLDQDGDLDMFMAGCCGAFSGQKNDPWVIPPASSVFLNHKSGHFSESQSLTQQACPAAALGDLDGDGDLDAFIACQTVILHSGVQIDVNGFNDSVQIFEGPHVERNRAPNLVYLNDGTGQLLESNQALGDASSYAVALGDLDGDGDLDAFVGNRADDEIWINQGGEQGGIPGQYTASSRRIANKSTKKITLGDVDGDGDLDALLNIAANQSLNPELWLNDGRAGFTRSRQELGIPDMQIYALGDIDGDRDLDIFAGSFDHGYDIWFNDGTGNYER
jgi:hypothetical protein